jgi:hypothetical protein
LKGQFYKVWEEWFEVQNYTAASRVVYHSNYVVLLLYSEDFLVSMVVWDMVMIWQPCVCGSW